MKRSHFSPALASFELAWTDAAFDTIYPEPPLSVLPHGVLSMHPARFFQSVLASAPLEQSVGLRLTLWMIALAPLFTIRKLGTIASIGPDDRVRVFERLLTSRSYFVRQLTMSFKAIATLLYVQSATVRAAMSVPVRPKPPELVTATRLLARARRTDPTDAGGKGGEHENAAE